MENKNIIIILLIIAIILAAIVGVMFLQQNEKKATKLKITSNSTLVEGDSLSIKLTDINGTPIVNQTVNVSIMDKDGSINHKTIVTNEKGKAYLKIDKSPGKYSINCTFEGNDKYSNSSAFKKIEIKEEVEESNSYQNEVYSTETYSQSYNEDYRPEVDSSGITREEADYWGWEYTSEHGGHYIGSNDHWDENAGMYHD